VRVVAGRFRGRRLRAVPGSATRPTSDRVREALFSILGERVAGARVLDLFAGTGALAIEALSRGARSAVLVEPATQAVAVIRANLDALDLGGVAAVRRTRAETFLRGQRDGPFDLVFLDPPYAIPVGLLAGLLARLAGGALAEGAVVVVEAAARSEPPPWPPRLLPAAPRRYGDTALHLATFGEPVAPGRLEPPPTDQEA
jgi:16S rRNA (guanine966-N2)-methyltransferase